MEPHANGQTKTNLSTLFDEINEKYKNNAWNIFEAYQKYKAYYDRKAKAQPLNVGDYVYLLDPRQQAQADKTPFRTSIWDGPFKVVKALSHSNYIVRRTETHRTQCVHRMRLRKFIPHDKIPDIETNENNYYTDPDAIDESDLFDKKIPIKSPTDTQDVNTSDTDFEDENPQEIVVDLLPEIPELQ